MCHPHQCICGTEVTPLGLHGLSCKKSSGHFPRHHQCNDLIKRGLSSAGFPAVLEPSGICRTDAKRPDGMTLIQYKRGRCLVWDFTCRDTLAPSHLAKSLAGAGTLAVEAEKEKSQKYANLEESHIFAPVCVETFGPWGPSALGLIKEIGSKIAESTGEPRSTSFLMQSIGMAVQRGNAISVLGTLPATSNLDEIFYL